MDLGFLCAEPPKRAAGRGSPQAAGVPPWLWAGWAEARPGRPGHGPGADRFTRVFHSSHRSAISRQTFYLTRPDSSPPNSRQGGQAQRCRHQMDSPCRPHSHHRDGSHPQEEAQIQDAGQHPSPGRAGLTACPVQGLGPRAAQRARRGVGATSSQRCPLTSAPAPVARSRTHFLHCQGPPPRTQAGPMRDQWGATERRGSYVS
ncbi:uncharacterized protein LOC125960605 [Orcinus orca]|uniref:uncharacterized protein LOC125960605 n=1 Tax=Orcinus orca TaxID=9733 RepID=UPI002112E248|nr:uncharacterized protein LOC125960605 [Orcinus orca]